METDDDPVNDAIRTVIDADTDEEVVYPRSVRITSLPKVSMTNCVPSWHFRASPPAKLTSDLPQMIPRHVTPPHVSRQPASSSNFGLPQPPSPNMQPLQISPPRFPPHVSPPHVQPTSRRGSGTFPHMVPTHVDVRARTLSLSQPRPAGTTAQDLLNGVLGIPSPANDPAPAATTLLSGLGGSISSVWSPVNDVRHPPIGQQRHQRSVSQLNPSFAPGTRPGNGIGNGLGLVNGGSPFLPSPSLPQSPPQLHWQSSQLSQPHTDITPHPRLNPIGHHRAQSSGVPSYLTSPNSMTSNLLNIRPAQPIPSGSVNFNVIDTSGGLGGSSDYPLARQGLSPTSQTLPYNLPFGNSLGIQGSGWEG